MTIALIEDDEAILRSLSLLLEGHGVRVRPYSSAESFLDDSSAPSPQCVVADIRLPGMSGIELQDKLTERDASVPIILITGHGDVTMAVQAIKRGAFDFIEKPFDDQRLLQSIAQAIEIGARRRVELDEQSSLRAKVADLSPRQVEVMRLVADGFSNKEIANKLNISPRTVENYRAWVMEKMGASNLADLVRKVIALGSYVCIIASVLMLALSGVVASSATLSVPMAGAAVDAEIVLAVDVSESVDLDELQFQREGYAEALTSKEFLDVLRKGPHGAVAIMYFEWSSANDQRPVLGWRIVGGPESADALAAAILDAPARRAGRTSISAAISFAMRAFSNSPYRGPKRVIDISGDGPNNNGEAVNVARDAAIAQGVTINGLPIMIKQRSEPPDIERLDIYYEDCVIGGPGAFAIAVRDRSEFKQAIRAKLLREIARNDTGTLSPVRARRPRVSCSVGEQLWRERWR
jgi:FixJ family two-component response regulator